MASAKVTYILWLFFGWFGIHHLYLGRVNQAIVWFATLGGGCGIGWIRDFWRIPDYLKWCNGDKDFQLQFLHRVTNNPQPSCSYFRLGGMFVMGFLTTAVLCATIPDFQGMYKTDSWQYIMCVAAYLAFMVIGNVIGVMLVANIGELTCTKYYPCYGAITSLAWAHSERNIALTTLLTVVPTWFRGLKWRINTLEENRNKGKRHTCKNVAVYLVACSLWVGLVSYGIYFNSKISINGEEKIPVREAIANFFKSPAWLRTKDSIHQLFTIYRHAGWGRFFKDVSQLFDFSGEVNAYKTLDLSPGAGNAEITKRCRKLKAEYHPDRFRTQEEKDKAQETFIEIQNACSKLSTVHSRRTTAKESQSENKKSNSDYRKSSQNEHTPDEDDIDESNE